MRKYQYTPLSVEAKEIRLLKLHPGNPDDSIAITILTVPLIVPEQSPPQDDRLEQINETLSSPWSAFETLEGRIIFWNIDESSTTWRHPFPQSDGTSFDLDEPMPGIAEPAFEALSYAWDSAESDSMVEVVPPARSNRIALPSEKLMMPVQKNVYDALNHLRQPIDTRTLWIDAICIDQENLVERSEQVRFMGEIYKYAQRVIVWSGLSFNNSSLALRKLAYMGDQVEISTRGHNLPAPGREELSWWQAVDAADYNHDPEVWSAVCMVLKQPWFERVWIVQEIQLANSSAVFQCGKDTILWRQLRRAILLCNGKKLPARVSERLTQAFRLRFSLALGSYGQDPLDRLYDAILARCSEPRDRVFALLGLLPRKLSDKIQPDYTQPVRDTYRDAVLAYLDRSGSLDFLALTGLSWIPDFEQQKTAIGWKDHHCSAGTTAKYAYIEPDTLIATGLIIDTVVTVAGPVPSCHYDILRMVNNVWLNGTSGQTYPTREPLPEVCAWMLTLGCLKERWATLSIRDTLAAAHLPFTKFQAGEAIGPDIGDAMYRPSFIEGGTMFTTSKGYYGFCMSDVLPGDKVSVLLGCSMPVLLRKQAYDRNLFVGCAYVHGIMDGEVLLGPITKEWRPEKLSNRYGENQLYFVNSVTGEETSRDPRLPPLPPEWRRIVCDDVWWPDKRTVGYENLVTGEATRSDPRLWPDALRARGIVLEEIGLV